MDYGRARAISMVGALILLALDVGASDALDAGERRKLIGKQCDQLESVLGRPRVFTTRVGQGRRGEKTFTEVRTYDTVTALCIDGRVTTVAARTPEPGPRRSPAKPAKPTAAPPAPSSPLVGTKPRLSPDRRTLVLLEEVREPKIRRQPEIALKVDPTSAARQITIAAQGMKRPATIRIGCEAGPHDLTLIAFSRTPARNTATFVVPGDLAAAVLAASSCYLSVAEAVIPLPRDLLPAVWGKRRDERRVESSPPQDVASLPAYGQVRYVNEDGVSHWVSSLEQVPERYREQVLERSLANKPAFEPTVRSQAPSPSPPLKWELVRRDFADSGQRLTRHILRAQLSADECLGLMKSTVDNDPEAGRHRSVAAKGGYGIGLFRHGSRDVPVKAWQCVEQE